MDLFARNLEFRFHSAASGSYTGPSRFREARVEVSVILEGSLCFIVDGYPRRVQGPCATLQAYRDDLQVLPGDNDIIRTMWCHFVPEALAEDDWSVLRAAPETLPIPALLPTLFSSAFAIGEATRSQEQAGFTSQVVNSLGRTILAEYLRNADLARQSARPPASVIRARQALDDRFASSWTLARLARYAGLNANYLVGLFKEHLGTTSMRYLWERRMSVGAHMLQTSTLPVEEIAFRCGFQSAAHFSRRIKEKTGASPMELRSGR